MNINKKEKQWLSVLGILVVGFIYYQFAYLYLDKAVADKSAQEQEIKEKFSNAESMIGKMDIQKYNVKVMNAKITDEAYAVYPTINQEHVIQEIDTLLKESECDGGMEFDFVESGAVDVIKKSDKDKGDLEGTMQESVDKYNDVFGDKKEQEKDAKSDEKSNESEETINSDSTDKNNQKEIKVVKMKGKVKFYGTYENVVKLVKDIKAREGNKICLYGISMDINDDKWVKGELGIGIYSVPKLDDSISKYLIWPLNNVYGKTEPFQTGGAAGNTIKKEKLASDFMVSAKGINSDLPTAMIGKTDNTAGNTYVFADKNDNQEAEMVLSKKDDKYYYKYKLGNSSMPVNYNGIGIEFTPIGDSIILSILSDNRISSEDKSSLRVNIINDTGMLVKVEVSGDENNNPRRISIGGDNKNISISQK